MPNKYFVHENLNRVFVIYSMTRENFFYGSGTDARDMAESDARRWNANPALGPVDFKNDWDALVPVR
jgi:hypothetical protein